jgi:predicted transport protein
MSDVEKALQTQIRNIQARTGKSLDALLALIRESGLEKHGQVRDMLKKHALGHGDANTLAHLYFKGLAEAGGEGTGDPLADIYAGNKAHLRPIHDALMAAIEGLGDFEVAPKKTYVSLRRRKQFATVGPATKTRLEVGLNMKGMEQTERLVALPAGRMCQYRVDLAGPGEVDAELVSWIRAAYDQAG